MRPRDPRSLPPALAPLADLALDLRWTWSHAGDALWRQVDRRLWERTASPWLLLQHAPAERLDELAADPGFLAEMQALQQQRQRYAADAGWFGRSYGQAGLRSIAYFSMEFGLGDALPLYAGGLGVLAGDYLKAASDLGVPVVGVGILWQQGDFRQLLDAAGKQMEVYPYNDPYGLPLEPVTSDGGRWMYVPLELPGRNVLLRVWRAWVGRVPLYLLDSNDPLNTPPDRGLTSVLYPGDPELRLMQEIILGIGGWRVLEAVGEDVEICHLNEGHAAFAVVERARRYMEQERISFAEALWATRAATIFTTHSTGDAGLERYSPALLEKYRPYFGAYVQHLGITWGEAVGLGRGDPGNPQESFGMATLAVRGAGATNAVSALHGRVSRGLLHGLYPRWPAHEVPVGHVTNGVHVPSWDSPWADDLWTHACGKDRWRGSGEALGEAIAARTDEELWGFRTSQREALVRYARERLAHQLARRGAPPEAVAEAVHALNPRALTLGFARRITEYKRPNLLLRDPERLLRLLRDAERPVQLIVAGKAHPRDAQGKALIRAWMEFAARPDARAHVIFLEDYDLSLAKELVQGVDVWLNTPRRPWEACGTSGMKVLVNGGLNLSTLDGWWAEAYAPQLGWAVGGAGESGDGDAADAEQLYRLLEEEVVPCFFEREGGAVPRRWVARMRASMAELAPRFSSNRMVRDYTERYYLPASQAFRRRSAQRNRLARELCAWAGTLRKHWHTLRLLEVEAHLQRDELHFAARVDLGEVEAAAVRVELYADPVPGHPAVCEPMQRGEPLQELPNAFTYHARVPASRPASHFTPRVVPHHPEARVPTELALIAWPR